MRKGISSTLLRHGIAVLTVGSSVLLTLYLHYIIGFTLNITPLAIVALIVSTWVGGVRQGLIALLLLQFTIDYYLDPPAARYRLEFRNEDLVRVLIMAVFVLLTAWRKRAQIRLREQTARQMAIADLGQKALSGADLQSLIENAATITARHLKIDYSLLCELLADGTTLEVKAGAGWKEDLAGRTAVLSTKAIEAGRLPESDGTEAIAAEPVKAELSYEIPLRDHNVVSSVNVVINGKERPYGVLSALTRRRRRFTSDEVAYLQAIANVLAEAIARKRSEEEREQLLSREQEARQQAEEANRLKDEFLATVSHELRTPLNHMLGWVTMLRNGNLQEDKTTQALETIERNVRAQNRLVEDLLDVSRIVTGRMQLHVQPVVPAKVIEAAIASARPAAEAKGVRLQVVLDSRPGVISGDPDRLQQVVWNLVSNAIKFTPKGGRVQVRLERINSHVEITVSDTGEGIAPEFLPHVFDRFSQADGTYKRRHSGLGLGLAIVRHLVELHGGSVRVTSPGLGEGSTFTVQLPLAVAHSLLAGTEKDHPSDADALESALGKQGVPRLDGVRVLVVDDEADARSLLTTILTAGGAEVEVAGGMDEALWMLSNRRPDVLVSDIGMPDGDGYDLIREVRRLNAGSGAWMPAVALTAYARTEDRMRALAAGFQMHVSKPVEPRELLMVVASLSGRLK